MPEWRNKRPSALADVPAPKPDAAEPVALTDDTMALRLHRVLDAMNRDGLDTLAIWCDLEHGSNFEYLTGFLTRFEEGLLVLQASGEACLVLGNENTKMAAHARLPARMLHCPFFSLPNQPMQGEQPLPQLMRQAGIEPGKHIGVVGWKLFTSAGMDNQRLFDLPAYVMDALRQAAGDGEVVNATALMIGPEGVRRTNNANEVAHYEYGSALASDCVIRTMEALAPGVNELALADLMNAQGQRCSVVTICATGPRYEQGNLYPRSRRLQVGDTVSMTCGYKGGLASRAGYAVSCAEELPCGAQDYLDRLVRPYFEAVTAWLETIRIGMTGGELYDLVDAVLLRSRYNWFLCPGHLTADEEWLCSPVYAGSAEPLRSGMLLQIDIIPSVPGYGGVGCENGILLADDTLQQELQAQYPELWRRMCARRAWIRRHIGIRIPDEVLPLSSGVGYLRPYLMRKNSAMVCR